MTTRDASTTSTTPRRLERLTERARDSLFHVHQASDAARDWAAKRKEAIDRAKHRRARRDDDAATEARRAAAEEEARRLRRRVKAAENAANERRAKAEAEALAAKIRRDVEKELAAERARGARDAERACAEARAEAATATYVKVVPDGTVVTLSGDVDLAPEPARTRVVPTATPRKSPTKETKTGEDAPEPSKSRAPRPTPRGTKGTWTAPNAKETSVSAKRAPLAANGSTSVAKVKENTPSVGAERRAPKTSTSRPIGGASKPSSSSSSVVVAKKRPTGLSEDKVHRQMFDKRESRRMNRAPFAASVKRWRNKHLSKDAPTHANANADADATRETSTSGSINIFARKRPLFEPEKKRGEFDVVSIENGVTAVVHNCQMHADLKRMFVKHCAYTLSGGVFDETAQEHDVYARSAAPLVKGTLEGGVGALFMYGQTGSGKTHTMENIEKHAIDALFLGEGGRGAASIKVSYFEIAGKTCVDLLQPGRVEIRLKELFEEQGDALTGQMEVELMGAEEPTVENAVDLKKVIDQGKSRRQTSATQCNASSSRSHAVMRLTVTNVDGVVGRLTLVDCAGSERKEDNTHHNEKQRKETAEINASLYALKECVRFRRLKFSGSGKSNVHVPYRNSPLTRVLAECFVREDAGVAVIGTVSPAAIDTEHSIATLKTINAIGGNDDNEGYAEEKEDVAATLRVNAKTGEVTEEAAERLVAPVKWSHDEVRHWLSTTARGAFKKVKVASTLTGSQFVRMSPLVLKNMCGGDDALAQKLHTCLRAEVTRCSVTQR
jgi:kinesin family protein 2/24